MRQEKKSLLLLPSLYIYSSFHSPPYHGTYDTYGGGGYVASLGSTPRQTREVISSLKRGTWLDRATRAILLEYTQYSINTGLFSMVTLMAEFLPTGGVVVSQQVESASPVTLSSGGLPLIYLLCEGLMLAAAICLLVDAAVEARRLRCRHFFADIWNWAQLLVAVLTVAGFGVYVAMVTESSDRYERYLDDRACFVNLAPACQLMAEWKQLNAILLFCIILIVSEKVSYHIDL